MMFWGNCFFWLLVIVVWCCLYGCRIMVVMWGGGFWCIDFIESMYFVVCFLVCLLVWFCVENYFVGCLFVYDKFDE